MPKDKYFKIIDIVGDKLEIVNNGENIIFYFINKNSNEYDFQLDFTKSDIKSIIKHLKTLL